MDDTNRFFCFSNPVLAASTPKSRKLRRRSRPKAKAQTQKAESTNSTSSVFDYPKPSPTSQKFLERKRHRSRSRNTNDAEQSKKKKRRVSFSPQVEAKGGGFSPNLHISREAALRSILKIRDLMELDWRHEMANECDLELSENEDLDENILYINSDPRFNICVFTHCTFSVFLSRTFNPCAFLLLLFFSIEDFSASPSSICSSLGSLDEEYESSTSASAPALPSANHLDDVLPSVQNDHDNDEKSQHVNPPQPQPSSIDVLTDTVEDGDKEEDIEPPPASWSPPSPSNQFNRRYQHQRLPHVLSNMRALTPSAPSPASIPSSSQDIEQFSEPDHDHKLLPGPLSLIPISTQPNSTTCNQTDDKAPSTPRFSCTKHMIIPTDPNITTPISHLTTPIRHQGRKFHNHQAQKRTDTSPIHPPSHLTSSPRTNKISSISKNTSALLVNHNQFITPVCNRCLLQDMSSPTQPQVLSASRSARSRSAPVSSLSKLPSPPSSRIQRKPGPMHMRAAADARVRHSYLASLALLPRTTGNGMFPSPICGLSTL